MRYLKIGKKLAKKSDKKFRHSALVMRGGALISQGYNKDKRHAEIHALRAIWKDTSLYVHTVLVSIRIRKNGSFGHSHPCDDCMKTIKSRGVAKIIYMNTKGEWKEEKV